MSDGMSENPLVSVCVITYNSAKTVIETLDSIKNQSYSPIEVIVSDDNSQDKTLEIVTNWVNENKDRFENVEIISSDINTGVTKNVNRACRKSQGVYVKDLAGDDILLPNYLENCIDYFEQHREVDVLFTKLEAFNEDKIFELPENYPYFYLSAEEQFERTVRNGIPFLPTPTSIYTKRILESVDYFDERIPMWEDGPMYFKLAENRTKLWLLDFIGVRYRVREESLSNAVPVSHIKSMGLCFKYYWAKYLKKNNFIKFVYLSFFSTVEINCDKSFFLYMYKSITKMVKLLKRIKNYGGHSFGKAKGQ